MRSLSIILIILLISATFGVCSANVSAWTKTGDHWETEMDGQKILMWNNTNVKDWVTPDIIGGGGHPLPYWAERGMENGTHSVYNVTESVYTPLVFGLRMQDYHHGSNCIEVKISNKNGSPVECIRKPTAIIPNVVEFKDTALRGLGR